MTTVSRKRHRAIVTLLSVVNVLLCVLLATSVLYIRSTYTYTQGEGSENETESGEVANGPFLVDEEVVIIESSSTTDAFRTILPVEKTLFEYVAVTDSCGPHFEGDCLLVRSGPGTDYPMVTHLRNGMVLKVGGEVEREDGSVWYKIVFDEWLRYPERVTSDWYVAAEFVEILLDEGDKTVWDNGGTTTPTTTKKIVVDRSEQKLYAYDGDTLFMETLISTGLELTPTPRGTFTVFKKTPSRYMQGPLPGLSSQQRYDQPGVPWNLYFTHGGAVVHGAYWHDSFGSPYSHGCVNLPPEKARELYNWAVLGTQVVVQE